MKLIDLLVQELPKRGGWPANSNFVVQDSDRDLKFGKELLIQFERDGVWRSVNGTTYGQVWSTDVRKKGYDDKFFNIKELSDDHGTAIVTREQYEAALQQPVWNGEGLPPVGCKFEYGSHRTAATCLGVGFDMVFAWKGNPLGEDYEEFMISIKDSSFHKPRTEAERKREEAEVNLRTCLIGSGAGITELAAKTIYDAIGAGKIPGVKLDL